MQQQNSELAAMQQQRRQDAEKLARITAMPSLFKNGGPASLTTRRNPGLSTITGYLSTSNGLDLANCFIFNKNNVQQPIIRYAILPGGTYLSDTIIPPTSGYNTGYNPSFSNVDPIEPEFVLQYNITMTQVTAGIAGASRSILLNGGAQTGSLPIVPGPYLPPSSWCFSLLSPSTMYAGCQFNSGQHSVAATTFFTSEDDQPVYNYAAASSTNGAANQDFCRFDPAQLYLKYCDPLNAYPLAYPVNSALYPNPPSLTGMPPIPPKPQFEPQFVFSFMPVYSFVIGFGIGKNDTVVPFADITEQLQFPDIPQLPFDIECGSSISVNGTSQGAAGQVNGTITTGYCNNLREVLAPNSESLINTTFNIQKDSVQMVPLTIGAQVAVSASVRTNVGSKMTSHSQSTNASCARITSVHIPTYIGVSNIFPSGIIGNGVGPDPTTVYYAEGQNTSFGTNTLSGPTYQYESKGFFHPGEIYTGPPTNNFLAGTALFTNIGTLIPNLVPSSFTDFQGTSCIPSTYVATLFGCQRIELPSMSPTTSPTLEFDITFNLALYLSANGLTAKDVVSDRPAWYPASIMPNNLYSTAGSSQATTQFIQPSQSIFTLNLKVQHIYIAAGINQSEGSVGQTQILPPIISSESIVIPINKFYTSGITVTDDAIELLTSNPVVTVASTAKPPAGSTNCRYYGTLISLWPGVPNGQWPTASGSYPDQNTSPNFPSVNQVVNGSSQITTIGTSGYYNTLQDQTTVQIAWIASARCIDMDAGGPSDGPVQILTCEGMSGANPNGAGQNLNVNASLTICGAINNQCQGFREPTTVHATSTVIESLRADSSSLRMATSTTLQNVTQTTAALESNQNMIT